MTHVMCKLEGKAVRKECTRDGCEEDAQIWVAAQIMYRLKAQIIYMLKAYSSKRSMSRLAGRKGREGTIQARLS